MKVRLQQFLKSNNQIVLETDTFFYKIEENLNAQDEIFSLPMAGNYCLLENELLMLFCIDNKIYLFFNNQFHLFNEKEIRVDYKEKNSVGILVFNGNNYSTEVIYSTEEMTPLSTFIYSEEEEDVNFGLWINNVLNDKERIEIVRDTCVNTKRN